MATTHTESARAETKGIAGSRTDTAHAGHTAAASADVGEMAAAAQEQGTRMASKAKEQTTAYLASKKDEAASAIGDVAEAARQAAETLRERNDGMVAGYAEAAADQAEALSQYLRQRKPAEVMSDLEDAARRHPAVLYGGLFVAGLAVSRFLRASERPHRES